MTVSPTATRHRRRPGRSFQPPPRHTPSRLLRASPLATSTSQHMV